MQQDLLHTLRVLMPFVLGVIFLLVYISEHIYPQRKELIDHQHDLKNISIGLINLALVFTGGYYFQQLIQYSTLHQFGLLQRLHLPFYAELIIGFLVIDFFMYWWHRINHTIPFFWIFHQYHHKDEKMNSTTAVRFHSVELILSYAVRILFFPLLGISLAPLLLHSFLLFPVIVFHHSNIRINSKKDLLLRLLIVTPLMHRIHHSVLKFETDSNYSSILPYWDMIFKTYHKQSDQPVKFGI